jgi:hypothetical protein
VRLLIAGSRTLYPTNEQILAAMSELSGGAIRKPKMIISGTAKGVDRAGERFASDYDIYIEFFPADWDKHGKKAGYLRNIEMADYCTHAIVFWDGVSKGTASMIDLLERAEIPHIVKVVNNAK